MVSSFVAELARRLQGRADHFAAELPAIGRPVPPVRTSLLMSPCSPASCPRFAKPEHDVENAGGSPAW